MAKRDAAAPVEELRAEPAPPDGAEVVRPGELPSDLRKRLKRRVDALVSELGLPERSAAVLVAHTCATHDDAEHLGETECVHWAKEFRRMHPTVWPTLLSGNLSQFQAALDRCEIEHRDMAEYDQLAALIIKV